MSTSMNRCGACSGFVPAGCDACPNCEPSQARTGALAWLRLGQVLRVSAGTAVAMTLMACYGAPVRPGPDEPTDKVDPKADRKTDAKTTDTKATDANATDAKTTDATPTDAKTTDAKPTDGAPK